MFIALGVVDLHLITHHTHTVTVFEVSAGTFLTAQLEGKNYRPIQSITITIATTIA